MTNDDGDADARLERIEKRLALYDLIASYGPAVDSGSAAAAADLWAEDGIYDFGNAVLNGRGEIESMVMGPQHQGLIDRGAAHLISFPQASIDGDRAVVTGYSQVCRFRDGHFELWRVSANRWIFNWDGSAWKVESRTTYPLDGRPTARALLRHTSEL